MTTPEEITPGNSDPETNPAGDGVDISSDSVAQGRWGKHTLVVMIVSIALVVLVLFGMFGLHAGTHAAKQNGAADPAQAGQAFNATEPSPKQNPPPQAVQAATPATSGS